MMTRTLQMLAGIVMFFTAICSAPLARADAFLKCDAIDGTLMGPDGSSDWFVADSFSFGVEREMKESGEKGSTEDINIGVGELQECTISKSMDAASAHLAQFAINGNSLGACQVCLTNGVAADGSPACYLHYKLERAFVKSWSTSGDADDRPTEEVAFYYNKIAFAYLVDDAAGNLREESMNWDNEHNRPWPDGLTGIFDILVGSPPPRDPQE
jgi:type VI protein secretion system component Hcp